MADVLKTSATSGKLKDYILRQKTCLTYLAMVNIVKLLLKKLLWSLPHSLGPLECRAESILVWAYEKLWNVSFALYHHTDYGTEHLM